jgi:phage FluMu protein Com
MEIIISGIKCDKCNWKDMTVPFEKYTDYLNKKCPSCNSILLTQYDYDYDFCLNVYKIINILNRINKFAKWFNPIYYYRLIFGDKRKNSKIIIDYTGRKI